MFGIPGERVTVRTWLGWYHLAAGLTGIVLTLFFTPSLLEKVHEEYRWQVVLMMLSIAILFGVVAFAGILILRRSRWGERIAIPIQLLQIPIVSVHPVRWIFFAGAYFVLSWKAGYDLDVYLGLKSSIDLWWSNPQFQTMIGINVVPFMIIWLLRRKLPLSEAPTALTGDELAFKDPAALPGQSMTEPLAP